jgi:hypothetical protein
MAKKMINANRPINEIIEFTDLSKEMIDKLINEMKNSH